MSCAIWVSIAHQLRFHSLCSRPHAFSLSFSRLFRISIVLNGLVGIWIIHRTNTTLRAISYPIIVRQFFLSVFSYFRALSICDGFLIGRRLSLHSPSQFSYSSFQFNRFFFFFLRLCCRRRQRVKSRRAWKRFSLTYKFDSFPFELSEAVKKKTNRINFIALAHTYNRHTTICLNIFRILFFFSTQESEVGIVFCLWQIYMSLIFI